MKHQCGRREKKPETEQEITKNQSGRWATSYTVSERKSGIYIIRCNGQGSYHGEQRVPGAATLPEGASEGKSLIEHFSDPPVVRRR